MAAKKRVAPKAKTSHRPARKKPTAAAQARPSSVLRVKRPLPAKSVEKAANAFKNFSLSRFAQDGTPANYVPAHQAKVPSAVAAVQRKSATTQMAALAANPPRTLGMTVALTPASLAALLPSLNAKAGTVGLTELLGALQQNLRGKEFYAAGNPTLNLVVQNFTLLSQVRAYINALKAGTVGSGAAVATPGATTQVGPATSAAVPAKSGAAIAPNAGAAEKPVAAKKRGV